MYLAVPFGPLIDLFSVQVGHLALELFQSGWEMTYFWVWGYAEDVPWSNDVIGTWYSVVTRIKWAATRKEHLAVFGTE